MWMKLKKMGCYLIIIILLPYVITVFINGPGITANSRVDQTYIRVQDGAAQETEDTQEAGNTQEMPLEDYGIGVMAKEIPAQ